MSWPTVRRYPRTMAQAFPREHANPIEHVYHAGPLDRFAGVLLACGIGIGLAVVLVLGWSK